MYWHILSIYSRAGETVVLYYLYGNDFVKIIVRCHTKRTKTTFKGSRQKNQEGGV